MKGKRINEMKRYLLKNKIVTNLFIASIGVILTILGVTAYNTNTEVKTILVSIGTSIISSILITGLSFFYIYEADNTQELYDRWGLISIEKTRSEMNVRTEITFANMTDQFDIIAFGLKSLRDAKGDRFKEKVKRGLKIRILTINSNSPFLARREIDEKGNQGDIKKTILDLAKWVEELQALQPMKGNVQIKYYNSMPLDYYCRQDNNIYIGPYLYGIGSQQTISYEFDSYGEGFRYYNNYFEKLWVDSELVSDSF